MWEKRKGNKLRTWAEGRERLFQQITAMMDANEWYRFYTSLTAGTRDKIAGRMVRRGIYICAFSNNQWNIASEMGWSSRYSRGTSRRRDTLGWMRFARHVTGRHDPAEAKLEG